MDEFHIHKVECQHPFGDGIHVMVPPNREIFWVLMHTSGLAEDLHLNVKALMAIAKESSKAASKVAVYQSPIMGEPGDEQYVIVNVLVNPDGEIKYRGLFVMIEKHRKQEGEMILKLIPEAMRQWL